ncbi:helix-turn-helix transcriptional regulator [Mesorhizobium sp.]|uniref:helix-turn-helix transcriptional regulator n=1 Tax=Mesorhizobium sp. TaxID=1871066 RepID=UPI0025D02059|nr:helix-turn-helix transcriptional regulator [Mesorhizobium sp.]
MPNADESLPIDVQLALEALYAAVAAPETWALALHQMARATNSVGCCFYPRNQALSLLHLPVSPDLREFVDAYVQGGWFQIDPHAMRGWCMAEEGRTLVLQDDIFPGLERNKSLYFHDFLQAWKLPDWAAVAFKADNHFWCMSLLRDARQGPVVADQTQILMALAPHFTRVIELATLFDRRRSAEQIGTLEMTGIAAMLLDWKGTVTALTTAAEALIGTDISVRGGQLYIVDGAANRQMSDVVAALRAGLLPPQQFVVVKREGKHPIVIQVTELPKLLSGAFGRAGVLLRLFDGERKLTAAKEALNMAFGLTPAEARLAVELGHEHSIDNIAERFSVSAQTARTQLRSVLRKTGTHKQSELVALMANMPRSR